MKPLRQTLESMAVILSTKVAFCSDCILLIVFILILLPCLFQIVTLIVGQATNSHGYWAGFISSFLLQEVICTIQCQGHYYPVIYCVLYLMNYYAHSVSLQKVAASCVWLASKLEENPRKARQVIIVFHWMECRRENFPMEHLDLYSKVRSF